MSTLIKNKTVFCLLIITLFTTFFFARSVVVRERWIVPTFLHVYSQLEHKQHITAMNLGYVNNWLKEGPFHLHLGRYMYPASVEMPTLDQRNFHPSYPPGAITQLYLLFKMLDITGLVPDIYEQRGIQLLLVIFCNYMLHFLLALVMCCLAFFVCHKLGFDKLNSTLLAIVPAIVLFHNAGNLYWFHFVYAAPVVVVPLFALYIFLELLRLEHTSPRILRTVQIMQPSLMFIGVFTSWLFVFVVLTVYVMRIVRREITLPVSLQNTMRYAKQSFLFFLPSLVAIGIWMYSIVFYQRYVASANILKFPLSSLGFTFSNNLLIKMGILTHGGQVSGIDDFIYNFKYALYIYTNQDYGLIGVLMLYTVFYLAIRCRKFMAMQACTVSPAVITYLMLFIPSLIYTLFLVGDDAGHHFAAQKYSPALSVSFVFAPIFILQMLKKNHLMPAVHLLNGKALQLWH